MSLLRRITNLFHRSKLNEDIEAELRAHIEMRTADSIAAGMSPENARRDALLRFGNRVAMKERVTAADAHMFLDSLWQDLCYGLRTLRKSPGFTAVAVLTLALGIGATTSVFSLAHTVIWHALPYGDSGRLIYLSEGTKSIPDLSLSYLDFLDWQQQTKAFNGLAAYQETNFDFDRNGKPERISGRNVSPNFFSMLGISPALGRSFVAADNSAAAPAVLLSSYNFWQTHLGADPNVIGTTVRLNNRGFTVVGVLPSDFTFESPADVYTPIGQLANSFVMQNRAKHPFIYAIARLRSGATFAEAQAELQTVGDRLQQQYPAANGGIHPIAKPLQQELVQGSEATLRALAIAVVFLLLISCANVANLLLSRASQREGEFAIRTALGARRGRIIRQVLTESVLLGLLGAASGLVLTSVSLGSLRVLIPADLRSMVSLRMSGTAVLFALIACIVAAVAFGLLPFLFTSRADLNGQLKSLARTGGSESARHRLRSALVISEIAFAFVVLASAGLVFRSFRLASHVNPGFALNNVLTMRISLSHSSYSTDDQMNAFFRQALDKLRTTPGVVNAGAVFPLPFTSNGYSYDFYIEGRPIPPPRQRPTTDFHFVTSGYFGVMGIPLIHGRDFSSQDNEKSPRVAIISENLAARFWSGSDAIGQRIQLDPTEGGQAVTVIGIVGNTKESGLDTPTETELYLPYAQNPVPFAAFVLRTNVSPLAVSTTVVGAIQSIDAVDPLYDIRAMNEYAASVLQKRRTNAFLFSSIALLTIVLSAIGVYAVISFAVVQRTHEIGVRMALGAQRGAIGSLVVKSGTRLVALGVAIGAVTALVVAREISNLLFGVRAADPLTFLAVTALLLLISLGACYIPARRAMRVDPMVALRYE